MIDTLCPICYSTDVDLLLKINSKYKIVKCVQCGLSRTFPTPIPSYDERNEFFDNYLCNEELFRSFCVPLGRYLKQFVSSGKILEIGSSTGYFLEETNKLSFQSIGIELNQKAANYCVEKGLNVINSSLEHCEFSEEYFDAVVMSHVLEHIPEPGEYLKLILKILKKNGYLVLSQPNYTGLVPKILKEKWYGWSEEDHLWHFAPKTISNMLEKAGFEVRSIKMNSLYYSMVWPFKNLTIASLARLSGLFGFGDQFYIAARK